jgi:hypothetical protein
MRKPAEGARASGEKFVMKTLFSDTYASALVEVLLGF